MDISIFIFGLTKLIIVVITYYSIKKQMYGNLQIVTNVKLQTLK